MKLRIWGTAALAACLVTASAATSFAQRDEEVTPSHESAGDSSHMGPSDMDDQMEHYNSYGACETCPTDGCDSGRGGLLGDLSGGRNVQLIAGAEYIYAQATFSEALAFVSQDAANGIDTFNQIDFDYESSYSFYGGFYMCDCGGAVIFDYTRLTSSGDYAASESAFVEIFAPFEIDGMIEGEADVELNSYDLSFSKTIPLGCLMTGTECGDSCDDACCDSGCGGWCPAWDITWSGGIRYADVAWGNTVTAFDPLASVPTIIDSATTTLDFDGFGGRVGLMGRRYLGKRGLFSLYGKGDFSVLFGDVDMQTAITNIAGTAFLRTSNEITVPVTEIELGGSAHLGTHATLSAGYFWSAWHDLGMSPTYDFSNTFQIGHFDDANILGWNGFFARAEIAF
jgi:hypothetical protein